MSWSSGPSPVPAVGEDDPRQWAGRLPAAAGCKQVICDIHRIFAGHAACTAHVIPRLPMTQCDYVHSQKLHHPRLLMLCHMALKRNIHPFCHIRKILGTWREVGAEKSRGRIVSLFSCESFHHRLGADPASKWLRINRRRRGSHCRSSAACRTRCPRSHLDKNSSPNPSHCRA